MTDDKRVERLQKLIAFTEVELKARLLEISEENLDQGSEKIALMAVVSLGLAAAALHSGTEALEQHGSRHIAEMTLATFMESVQPELDRLRKALDRG